MYDAKIALSEVERQLVSDPGWILTKNQIIRKAALLLDQIQQILRPQVQSQLLFPAESLRLSPKISKGENYQGLPYLILDYPRLFSKEEILAARFMFWWGHPFSLTFHFRGRYAKSYGPTILKHLDYFKAHAFYICVNEEEWEHHFETDNYRQIRDIQPDELRRMIEQSQFLKIATLFPLQQWDDIPHLMADCFLKTTGFLND